MLTWQLHAENEWRFGEQVRGAVRKPYYAEIYFTEGLGIQDQGWVWMTHIPGKETHVGYPKRGLAHSFQEALDASERVLFHEGILR